MEIKEFVRNLDTDKVYFVNFRGAGTWATIYNNRLIFADGSGNTVDRDIMLFDGDRVFIYDAEEAYCYANCNEDNQIYPVVNKMPELRTGMFVEANMCGYGVVVNDEIIFQNGTHDTIEDMTEYIIKVFEATCFIDCEDDVGVIWEKNKC